MQANVDGADLALGRRAPSSAVVEETKPQLPRGIDRRASRARSRAWSRRSAASATASLFAVVLVYLLMVVNFQSWLDPFIILMALPGALAGIAWMLFLSRTTLSVPALMGAIMCVGVATANSILVVTLRQRAAQARARRRSRPRWPRA